MVLFVNYFRQPETQVNNAYRYLLEKRSVSCHAEATAQTFNDEFAADKNVIDNLRKAFLSRNQTLYEVEASLVDRIANGKF